MIKDYLHNIQGVRERGSSPNPNLAHPPPHWAACCARTRSRRHRPTGASTCACVRTCVARRAHATRPYLTMACLAMNSVHPPFTTSWSFIITLLNITNVHLDLNGYNLGTHIPVLYLHVKVKVHVKVCYVQTLSWTVLVLVEQDKVKTY